MRCVRMRSQKKGVFVLEATHVAHNAGTDFMSPAKQMSGEHAIRNRVFDGATVVCFQNAWRAARLV